MNLPYPFCYLIVVRCCTAERGDSGCIYHPAGDNSKLPVAVPYQTFTERQVVTGFTFD